MCARRCFKELTEKNIIFSTDKLPGFEGTMGEVESSAWEHAVALVSTFVVSAVEPDETKVSGSLEGIGFGAAETTLSATQLGKRRAVDEVAAAPFEKPFRYYDSVCALDRHCAHL